MRNKSKKKSILIILGIIFAIAALSNFSFAIYLSNNDRIGLTLDKTKLKIPKSSGYWTVSFIHVDGNWSATASTYTWCSGDGSWSNPYIIENVTIDASTSPTGNGILINNSKNEYFIIRNCTVYNANMRGIWLENTNNGSLKKNTCMYNAEHGIILYNNCINNTILENVANDNTWHGIQVHTYSSNNTISGNTIYNNGWCGIRVRYNSINNIISGNSVNNNIWEGIYLDTDCDNNIISGNIITYNGRDGGIRMENTNNGILTGNNCSHNGGDGIHVEGNCNNNIISGNALIDNSINGIWLRDHCENNIVSNNMAYKNSERGITMSYHCINNTVSGNTANNNSYYGILISNYCTDNTISNNIAIDNNPGGIHLWTYCDDNVVSGNIINDNDDYGIHLHISSRNTISGNFINYNDLYGVFLDAGCDDNLLYLNGFIENEKHARDEGNNQWDNGIFGNYWDNYSGYDILPMDGIGDTPHSLPINENDTKPLMDLWWDTPPDIPTWYPMPNLKVSHFSSVVSYKSESIVLDFSISNDGIWSAEGVIIIVRCEVLDLTLFNNTNSPLTLEVDETEYIAVNIPPIGQTGTFSLDLIVDPYNDIDETYSLKDGSARINAETDNSQTADLTILPGILSIAITSQVFSADEFDITFFIYDETGQFIDFATIQLWWDGVEVSGDVQNIGNGFYSISLDAITVTNGEDPILLEMTITASGYEDKYFETYIAVDPDTLDKNGGGITKEPPLTIIIIAITSIVGGIVVIGVVLVLMRRRKQAS